MRLHTPRLLVASVLHVVCWSEAAAGSQRRKRLRRQTLIDSTPSVRSSRDEIEYDLEHLPFKTTLLQTVRSDARRQNSSHGPPADRKPILWLHLHKAGGSLMCALAQLAGERVVRPHENCNWKGHDGYFDSGHPEHGLDCRWRTSFFKTLGLTWGQIERELWPDDLCFDNFDYGVLLREPISLMRSMMNFHPEKGKEFINDLKDRLRLNNRAPPECNCQDELWKFMDNFQTRVLASALDVPVGQVNETHLEAAKALLSKFMIIGRLEDFPDGEAQRIFEMLGWKPEMLAHIGTKYNPSYTDEFDFTHEEQTWFRAINKHDIDLYEAFAPVGREQHGGHSNKRKHQHQRRKGARRKTHATTID